MIKNASALMVVGLIILASFVYAAPTNWPTWRGPAANGVSPDGTPPVKWSETENVKWKVKLEGDASDSSPIVWEDKIFFLSAVEAKSQKPSNAESGERPGRREQPKKSSESKYAFKVNCLDRLTGKTLWATTVKQTVPHEGHHRDHGFVSYSPVTDGKFIWADFGSRGTYCLDFDGKIKWSKELGKKSTRNEFGEGGSPAIVGDKLILLWDQEEDSFVYALDKLTGEIAWKQPRDERTNWTTPFVVKAGEKEQVVINGFKSASAYDPQTGSVIWTCSGQTENPIPTPVADSEKVYITSGFRGSKMQAIKLGQTGDLTGTDAVVWEVNEGTPYVPSPILYENKIYVCAGNNPVVSCYNAADGKGYYVKEELDEIKGIYASPAAAAGNVYFVGRNGATCVLKNSDKLEVLSINKLDDGIDCSPAIYGSQLFLKGKQNLYCIENKQ